MKEKNCIKVLVGVCIIDNKIKFTFRKPNIANKFANLKLFNGQKYCLIFFITIRPYVHVLNLRECDSNYIK